MCVHTRHCCIRHGGCQYGDEDCPVENGFKKQDHPCEYCHDEGITRVEDIPLFDSDLEETKRFFSYMGIPHVSEADYWGITHVYLGKFANRHSTSLQFDTETGKYIGLDTPLAERL